MNDLWLSDFSAACTEVHLVEPEILNAKIPLSYAVSYTGQGALTAIGYFENGLSHFKLPFKIRCFFSTWTAAVVISLVSLEAVRDPHIREWFSSFSEVDLADAKKRLADYPDWPYDGRSVSDMYKDRQDPKEVLGRSLRMLKQRGLDIPKKW